MFCFVAVSTIGGADPKKNFVMVSLGALLATVGQDIYDGADRYTFDLHELIDGMSLVPVAMGLFGLSEIMMSIRRNSGPQERQRIDFKSMLPSLEQWRRSFWPMIRGAASGCFFGPLPGTGPSVATILSYANEKKLSKRPSEFGKGAIEGIAAPESANNAAVQTAFVPTLALGIPGTPTMAIMIGALMIHGIVPGPLLMTSEPQLFWGLVAAWITRQAGTSMAYGETFLFLPVAKHVPLYALAVLAWLAFAGHLARGWLTVTGSSLAPGAGKAEQVG